MRQRRILFVVEGDKAEPKLLRSIFRAYDIDSQREVVSYRTNVHVLLNELNKCADETKEGIDALSPGEIELLPFLISREHDKKKRDQLSGKYTDIILVFDYEPQDPNFDSKGLAHMLSLFPESTDNGKLYINYPMLESYRDMQEPPDVDFLTRTMLTNECNQYKKLVGKRGRFRKIEASEKERLSWVVKMTVMKVLALSGLLELAPSFGDGCQIVETHHAEAKLLDIQNALSRERGEVYVCCTALLFVSENWPSKVLEGPMLPTPTCWDEKGLLSQ